jgi:hypothetical protein
MTKLTELQIESFIRVINRHLRTEYQCESGYFPNNLFGSNNDWVFDMEDRGYIEISSYYTKQGYPVLLDINCI